MFSFENYLPITSFNESSIFFKALEVFRYGFLMESIEGEGRFKQLYSYHNYYVEIIYEVNYEEIKSINAISIYLLPAYQSDNCQVDLGIFIISLIITYSFRQAFLHFVSKTFWFDHLY